MYIADNCYGVDQDLPIRDKYAWKSVTLSAFQYGLYVVQGLYK